VEKSEAQTSGTVSPVVSEDLSDSSDVKSGKLKVGGMNFISIILFYRHSTVEF